MRKEDLAKKLFDEKLAVIGDYGNFHIKFNWLAQRKRLQHEFVCNMADAFSLLRNQNEKDLRIIFNMPQCNGLVGVLAKELDLGKFAEYYGKLGQAYDFSSGSEYVMISGCISDGRSICDADALLQQHNAHIKYGLYFVDLQNWSDALRNMPVKIYSTLTKADLEKALQNK